MRILEIDEKNSKSSGFIEIDGLDISTIGLKHLRKVLAIIPQEPFLLEGSIKYNIDPFGDYTNE